MSKIQRFMQRFQIKIQRTYPLTKVVVAAAILLSTVTLVTIRMCQQEHQEKLGNLYAQAAALEEQNADLTARIDNIGTVESIRQIAAEELGMVDPDSIIFDGIN